MESGLHQPSLACVQRRLAGQQSFSEKGLRAAERQTLRGVGAMLNQEVTDVIGVRNEISRLADQAKTNEIAVLIM
jgi:hypothetical protein